MSSMTGMTICYDAAFMQDSGNIVNVFVLRPGLRHHHLAKRMKPNLC